jgi:hypothetical protein
MEEKGEHPPESLLYGNYNQTYIINSRNSENDQNEASGVLFQCGSWCYSGTIQWNGIKLNLEEIPIIIPMLQRQQGSLRYCCRAKWFVAFFFRLWSSLTFPQYISLFFL